MLPNINKIPKELRCDNNLEEKKYQTIKTDPQNI